MSVLEKAKRRSQAAAPVQVWRDAGTTIVIDKDLVKELQTQHSLTVCNEKGHVTYKENLHVFSAMPFDIQTDLCPTVAQLHAFVTACDAQFMGTLSGPTSKTNKDRASWAHNQAKKIKSLIVTWRKNSHRRTTRKEPVRPKKVFKRPATRHLFLKKKKAKVALLKLDEPPQKRRTMSALAKKETREDAPLDIALHDLEVALDGGNISEVVYHHHRKHHHNHHHSIPSPYTSS